MPDGVTITDKTGADVYAYWRACLAGKPDDAMKVPTGSGVDDSPQPGIYKTRKSKGGPWVPCSIYLTDQTGKVRATWDDGLIVNIVVDGQPVNNISTYDRHMFFEAVSKADNEHYKTHGRWPGEIAVTATSGDNSKNMTIPEQIAALIAEAEEWVASIGGKATTRELANEATNWKQKIAQKGHEANKERETEKAPHLEKCQEIDGKWRLPIRSAEAAAARIGSLADGWAAMERKRLQDEANERHRQQMEEHRKAQEEAAAAAARERERIEKERAAAAEVAIAAGAPQELMQQVMESLPSAEDIAEKIIADVPPPPAPEVVKIEPLGGQFGRKASARGKVTYEVVDFDAAYQEVKSNEKVREAIAKAAQALSKARGAAVAGCEARESTKVV